MQARQVLITGGAGRIGSHIADAPGQDNSGEVIILDNSVGRTRRTFAGAIEGGRIALDWWMEARPEVAA